jgi:hypothetical protein
MKRKTTILLAFAAVLLLAAVLWIVYNGGIGGSRPDCNNYSYYECPKGCVICPPCAFCSSLSCQTEEYCKSLGFNASWYGEVKA